MKKGILVWLMALFAPISAFAQSTATTPDLIITIKNGFIQVVKFVLLDTTPNVAEDILLIKGMLFLLILVVLYSAARKIAVFQSRPIAWLVSLIVSVIAVRFFTEAMLRSILLPYTALGIAISVIIPLFLFVYFLQGVNRYVRRFGYIFFAVALAGLWISRWTELGEMAWVYLVFSILTFFMLAFDGTLHRWVMGIKFGHDRAMGANAQYNILLAQRNTLLSGIGTVSVAKQKQIMKQIKNIDKAMKDLHKFI